MKKIIFAGALAFLLIAGTAQAHFLSFSSVDDEEIRWGGSTTYSSQWSSAISTWNGESTINIAPDTIWTYQDLTVSDVNDIDLPWPGQYTYYPWGSDKIKLNEFYMDLSTSAQKENVTVHELGHSLGLDHSISGNVLYSYQTSQTSLGSHDTSDYDYLWN